MGLCVWGKCLKSPHREGFLVSPEVFVGPEGPALGPFLEKGFAPAAIANGLGIVGSL